MSVFYGAVGGCCHPSFYCSSALGRTAVCRRRERCWKKNTAGWYMCWSDRTRIHQRTGVLTFVMCSEGHDDTVLHGLLSCLVVLLSICCLVLGCGHEGGCIWRPSFGGERHVGRGTAAAGKRFVCRQTVCIYPLVFGFTRRGASCLRENGPLLNTREAGATAGKETRFDAV